MNAKKSKIDVKKKSPESTTPAPASAGAAPLVELRDEIDRLFERASQGWPSFGGPLAGWSPFRLREPLFGRVWAGKHPTTDIQESDKAYTVTMELPGVEEKDLDVEFAGDMLTVKGEKKSERSEKDENYHLSERTYGSFERSFRLPDDVDGAKATATFAKGVLSIALPKQPSAKPKARKINVKAKA